MLSSFSLLWQFPTDASVLVSGGRLVFGIGATAVSMVFIPIFVITGEPPTGLSAECGLQTKKPEQMPRLFVIIFRKWIRL